MTIRSALPQAWKAEDFAWSGGIVVAVYQRNLMLSGNEGGLEPSQKIWRSGVFPTHYASCT
jgi:hypothetical protein